MNPFFPDWNIEFPVPNQKNPHGLDHELVELLWENGQVVLQSQTHRKPGYDPTDSRQVDKGDQSAIRGSGSSANPSNLIQDNEIVSWIHCQVDDSFEKEFSAGFLSEFPLSNPVEADKQIQQLDDNKLCKIYASEINHLQPHYGHASFSANPLLHPTFETFNSAQQHANLGGISRNPKIPSPVKTDFRSSKRQFEGKGASNVSMGEVREYSSRTVGSSHCGSNQVVNVSDASRASSFGIGNKGLSAEVVKNYAGKVSSQSERGERETLEPAITSSSGGSGTSFGRACNQSTGTDSCKRKTRDAEDSECQSEAAVLESAARKKPAQKSRTTRKSRAAEVHNLSERRRRDRINEKMRALQELLPHCNKSDKASMLDEAIEYMKSLQLHIQMMWMGGGMAPMMFPGVQHYMSRLLGMGVGPPTIPSIHNPMHLSRLPLVDQAMPVAAPTPNQAAVCQTTMLNPINYQNQLQNPTFSEQCASYMGFPPLQSASQPVNIFSFGSNMAPQSHNLAPPSNSNGPSVG